jgi:hypothetical protein
MLSGLGDPDVMARLEERDRLVDRKKTDLRDSGFKIVAAD